ncbi:MAG: cell envelope integrity protein CreD [Pseudomonadota bacterium]
MQSAGFRFGVVVLLTLLMFVPLFFAGAVVQDRKAYAEQTRTQLGQEWGGPQIVGGPVLIVPVEGDVSRQERVETVNRETGETEYRMVTRRSRDLVAPVVLRPETLEAEMTTTSDARARGIFEVPVFQAAIAMETVFDTSRIDGILEDGETLLWDDAVIHISLSNNAGLRGQVGIDGPDGALSFEPAADGIAAPLGALRGRIPLSIAFDLNGAERLMILPSGRDTSVTMRGDWADPSFTGAFLPDARDVTEEGFSAAWTIPHLARSVPQVTRGGGEAQALGTAFLQVNDFYQKAWRAARYGILFIALTFLTILLLERKDRPTHPVQYVLIGLAQSLFVLLMVAYAEQIGFTAAYGLSAGATTILLTLFAWTGLKLGQRSLVVGAALMTLYGVLFLILRSNDLALLAGATLAFAALSLTIFLTRNEDWYGPSGPGAAPWDRPKTTDPRYVRVPVTPADPAPA